MDIGGQADGLLVGIRGAGGDEDDDEKIRSELHSAREGENNEVRGRKKKAVALGGGRTLDRMKFQFYEL